MVAPDNEQELATLRQESEQLRAENARLKRALAANGNDIEDDQGVAAALDQRRKRGSHRHGSLLSGSQNRPFP